MFNFSALQQAFHQDAAIITRFPNQEQDAFGDPITEDPQGDPIDPTEVYNGSANLQKGINEITLDNKKAYDAVVFIESTIGVQSRDSITIETSDNETINGVVNEVSPIDSAVTININS